MVVTVSLQEKAQLFLIISLQHLYILFACFDLGCFRENFQCIYHVFLGISTWGFFLSTVHVSWAGI